MLTLNRTRLSPVGLHLGHRQITVVQLTGSLEHPTARTTVQRRLPFETESNSDLTDSQLTTSLRQLVNEHRLVGQNVVTCLRADELFTETIRLPQLPPEEVTKAISFEAVDRLPFPIDDAELRHVVAGDVRQDGIVKQEVILLAAQRDCVKRRLKVLEEAGLVPIGIDVEPCAWLRSLHRAGKLNETSRLAFLHCGEAASTVMFAEGQHILFLKTFPIGGRQFDEAVQQCFDLDEQSSANMRSEVFSANQIDGENEVHRSVIDALRPTLESLVSELELCLRYFKVTFRGRTPMGIVLTGSEATPWLADYLGDRIGVTSLGINPLDCLHHAPSSGSIQQRSGRWATALGLALKRMT